MTDAEVIALTAQIDQMLTETSADIDKLTAELRSQAAADGEMQTMISLTQAITSGMIPEWQVHSLLLAAMHRFAFEDGNGHQDHLHGDL